MRSLKSTLNHILGRKSENFDSNMRRVVGGYLSAIIYGYSAVSNRYWSAILGDDYGRLLSDGDPLRDLIHAVRGPCCSI